MTVVSACVVRICLQVEARKQRAYSIFLQVPLAFIKRVSRQVQQRLDAAIVELNSDADRDVEVDPLDAERLELGMEEVS